MKYPRNKGPDAEQINRVFDRLEEVREIKANPTLLALKRIQSRNRVRRKKQDQ